MPAIVKMQEFAVNLLFRILKRSSLRLSHRINTQAGSRFNVVCNHLHHRFDLMKVDNFQNMGQCLLYWIKNAPVGRGSARGLREGHLL